MADSAAPAESNDDHGLPEAPPSTMQVIKYARPAEKAPKVVVPLVRSDIMYCAVQVLRAGGENNLHSHTGMDGLWFVLRGRARFYGKDDVLIGEFGPHEGVFVPRNVPYWFEGVGDEPLEILQAEAVDRRVSNRRVDYEAKKASYASHKTVRGASQPA